MNFQIAKRLAYWILQILMWVSLIYENLSLIVICYIILVLVNLFSKFLLKLHNKKDFGSIEEYLNKLFISSPIVTMTVECFHYKNAKRDDKRDERIVTYTKTEHFKIKSSRDASGLCNLIKKDKFYMELNLLKEIEFDDYNTRRDYEKQLDNFIENNRSRDKEISFIENKEISVDEHSLFQIREDEPYFASWGWYIFFTLLTLPEPYKMYMENYCFTKDFTLRKIISSKKDLYIPENFKKWEHLIPYVKIQAEGKNKKSTSRDNIETKKLLLDPIQGDLAKPNRAYCDEEQNYIVFPKQQQQKQILVLREVKGFDRKEENEALKYPHREEINLPNPPNLSPQMMEPSQIPQQSIIYPQAIGIFEDNKKHHFDLTPNESFSIIPNPKPVKQKFSEHFPNSDVNEGSRSKKFKEN